MTVNDDFLSNCRAILADADYLCILRDDIDTSEPLWALNTLDAGEAWDMARLALLEAGEDIPWEPNPYTALLRAAQRVQRHGVPAFADDLVTYVKRHLEAGYSVEEALTERFGHCTDAAKRVLSSAVQAVRIAEVAA